MENVLMIKMGNHHAYINFDKMVKDKCEIIHRVNLITWDTNQLALEVAHFNYLSYKLQIVGYRKGDTCRYYNLIEREV